MSQNNSVKIIEQQAALLYEQSPMVNAVTIVVACLLAWFFIDRVDGAILISWTSALVVVALLRMAIWFCRWKYRQIASARQWIFGYVILTGVMGLVWGAASIFYFLVDDVQVNTLLYVLVCGVTTAGVPVLAAWFPAYLVYTLPQVGTLVSVTLYQANFHPETQALSFFLIFTLLVYYSLLVSLARRSHNHIYSELKLKNSNSKLVEELNQEVIQRESLIEKRTQELVRANLALKQSQNHLTTLSSAVEASPNGILITDADGIIQYLNPKGEQITGYMEHEVRGSSVEVFRSDEQKSLFSDIWASISNAEDWNGEIENKRKNGERYWIKEYVAPIHDDNNEISHYVAILEDITEARTLANQLSYQATHDSLTGLINRTEFESRLEALVADTHSDKQNHVLCFIDLDQFKVINDTCGHVAGDELLRQLAKILIHSVRKSDTLARLGGDEFAVIMVDCDLRQAEKVANHIRELIEDFQFIWQERAFSLGASIGVTSIDASTNDMNQALREADTACYAAKNSGRNRVYLYQSNDNNLKSHQGELRWVNEIKQALTDQRFQLFIQPIVSSDSEKPEFFEVLLRLEDEHGGFIPPQAFLPSAERYNLSTEIDLWVLDHVLDWLSTHHEKLAGLKHLAINLSGATLADEAMLTCISDRLKKITFEPDKLKFEITETAAIANLRQATHFINAISELGCSFALDDFGSGLSSFGYLKNLPVHSIKIDGMFVKDMNNDPLDYEMVKSINDIGHVMGLKTIAEFVEDEQIWHKLKSIGVDYGQGYYLGKPVPIDSILDSRSFAFSATPSSA